MKERKELFAGTRAECENWIEEQRRLSSHPKEYEVVRNPSGPNSVFYRHQKKDATIRAKISRETRELFKVNGVTKNHKRPLVVSLEPGDLISFRPKGTSQVIAVPIARLYNAAKWLTAVSAVNKKKKKSR